MLKDKRPEQRQGKRSDGADLREGWPVFFYKPRSHLNVNGLESERAECDSLPVGDV